MAGNIALISRGVCPFGNKSALAGVAGAAGAIIYNNVPGPLAGTLGEMNAIGPYVPTAGIAQSNGTALLNAITGGAALSGNLFVESIIENRTTENVLAQTLGGDQDNVLQVGAHSDSVVQGPGINDNGSGSIALLEIATNIVNYAVNNAVRFSWWSAEEFGLLGAEYYVSQLSAAERNQIRLYLNFDMVASPNYIFGVYDGDGSAFNLSGPAGSAEAEALFVDYFASVGLNSTPTEFSGRSDYGPFLEVDIAAGGLFTGAEVPKTPAQVELFGGVAGLAYDENYHEAGDTVQNLNPFAFLQNTRAIAHAVATYATSFESLPPRNATAPAKKRSLPKRAAHVHEHKGGSCGSAPKLAI